MNLQPTNESLNEASHSENPARFCEDKYPFSEDEFSSIIKVFSLLKKQRDKLRDNNLDTQVDTFEPIKNI